MALISLSWLLHLATLCHLTVLLAGQHHGVTKCNITCSKMTSKIPVALLIHYQQNQESCGKRAIVLETRQHRLFCADPKEQWVKDAMQHLDRQAAALTRNGGTFEKQIGLVKPRTTLAARGMDDSVVPEPEATGESSSLKPTPSSREAQTALGTSPEQSTGMTGSSGTGLPLTTKAQDGGPVSTELFPVPPVSTAIACQSFAPHQPGPGLWAEGKTPEALSTQDPSTQASSSQVSTTSSPAPEENTPSEGQPVWGQGQSPRPENSLEREEMGRVPAHTDAFQDWGPGSMAHVSVVPVSSEGTPSREPVASGSWTPKAEEPIHATMDPQRLGVLITPVPDAQAATRRQAVGLLAFLGLLFCLGVAMFAYQSLQGCPRKMAGEMVEGLRYIPRSCGSNSYVLVPV
ncbi:PREDICTED: fractalkine isoform X2 [Colobus angolensis palliatus]|uniref:Chemokine interleukin-8-like domain-containing protein n=1 Tax=Colobus angolensis palliatus TaxID=336983 RepID=A0A2K5I309_COLAP|nr:PREDICTED: fractalkine isoform X2 [Colobus angolensis palliatus]